MRPALFAIVALVGLAFADRAEAAGGGALVLADPCQPVLSLGYAPPVGSFTFFQQSGFHGLGVHGGDVIVRQRGGKVVVVDQGIRVRQRRAPVVVVDNRVRVRVPGQPIRNRIRNR